MDFPILWLLYPYNHDVWLLMIKIPILKDAFMSYALARELASMKLWNCSKWKQLATWQDVYMFAFELIGQLFVESSRTLKRTLQPPFDDERRFASIGKIWIEWRLSQSTSVYMPGSQSPARDSDCGFTKQSTYSPLERNFTWALILSSRTIFLSLASTSES